MKERIIAGILSVVALYSAASCFTQRGNEYSDYKFPTNKTDDNELEISNEDTLTLIHGGLYDGVVDSELFIGAYLNADFEQREVLKFDYLRALYTKLYNSGVPMETYLEELNNLLVLQQEPREFDEEEWNSNFEHLINILEDYPSLQDMFMDLAVYCHEVACEEEHNLNEYYGYSCPVLELQLN